MFQIDLHIQNRGRDRIPNKITHKETEKSSGVLSATSRLPVFLVWLFSIACFAKRITHSAGNESGSRGGQGVVQGKNADHRNGDTKMTDTQIIWSPCCLSPGMA